METRELFKKRVIELIHWLPYDEAIKKEKAIIHELWLPITIWRVMKALHNNINRYFIDDRWELLNVYTNINYKNDNLTEIFKTTNIIWKLTNEDWSECTDNDQPDETIDKLYNLIK